LRSRLAFHESAYSSADANVINALELTIRLLSNIDADLEREARMVVDTCNTMITTGRVPSHTAAVLKIASYLATLGKLSIDREKLGEFYQNPSNFSPDEQEYFQNIPVYSQLHAAQFESIPELGKTLRSYHENIDGSGYPDGLSAQNIPEAAKYLAVAVFYSESPLSTKATIDRIRRGAGTIFSPDAVSVFMEAHETLLSAGKIQRIMFRDLKPGMVIGEDIRSDSGAVVLAKGASLSSIVISTLRESKAYGSQQSSLLVHI
jgi:response regulator RpfG family c-di-GMP phosphodiesterase